MIAGTVGSVYDRGTEPPPLEVTAVLDNDLDVWDRDRDFPDWWKLRGSASPALARCSWYVVDDEFGPLTVHESTL